MAEFEEWHECLDHNDHEWLNELPMFEGTLLEEYDDVANRKNLGNAVENGALDAEVAKRRFEHRLGAWSGLSLNLVFHGEMENRWPTFHHERSPYSFALFLEAVDETRARFRELRGDEAVEMRERQEDDEPLDPADYPKESANFHARLEQLMKSVRGEIDEKDAMCEWYSKETPVTDKYDVRIRLAFERGSESLVDVEALTKAVGDACLKLAETHSIDGVGRVSWSVNGSPWRSFGGEDNEAV